MIDVVIIGNGEFPRKDYPRYLIKNADIIVCCDRGAEKFIRASKAVFGEKRLPDFVVGDMDSLSASLQKQLSDRLIHISEQDDNDQTKAFRFVMERFKDIRSIRILGATGLREDHTIGNLSLLMEYARTFDLSGIEVEMVSDYSTAFAITDSCELHIGEGRRFSLFTPDNTLKIKSRGPFWPLDNVVFDNWWKATLNVATEDIVSLEFSHPSIALIILD